MPTQSDLRRPGEWTAQTDTHRRSVFGNYRAAEAPLSGPACSGGKGQPAGPGKVAPPRQSIEIAVARSFIHRFLAKAYEDPSLESWQWLTNPQTTSLFLDANALVGPSVLPSAEAFLSALQAGRFESYFDACLAAFGHAARGSCPLNEIEYGDLKADLLFQPHRLADLAAFYRAFGLEVADDAGERHDHICLELEFMCVLAAKEAYALEHQLDTAQLEQCRGAQKKFLREHLGRWTPACTRQLAAATDEPTLQALAGFTRAFIESECARFGVNPGSDQLALRSVDEAAERLCDACGILPLPPGVSADT